MSCKRLKKTALALEYLEPALWGTLKPCLLALVFLRLPVAQMLQLRLLSKHWKTAIDSVESDFNMLLEDKIYPNLFGLIGTDYQGGGSRVWMFDVNQDRWCVREIDLSVYGTYLGATDGGLICLVSKTRKAPQTIVVMNPLTGKKVELPHLVLELTTQPTMLQIKVNRKTNEYQVFFVGHLQHGRRGKRGLIAQVYDSRTKKWSIVGPRQSSWGRISGYEYDCKEDGDYYRGNRGSACVYDFGGEEDGDCDDEIEFVSPLVSYDFAHNKSLYNQLKPHGLYWAMSRNRSFVFKVEKRGSKYKYFISEFHLQQNASGWLEGRSHSCEPLDDYPSQGTILYLHACNEYLMVMAYDFESVHVWLYNLSTYKWHLLPNVPGLDWWSLEEDVLMCELRLSATP